MKNGGYMKNGKFLIVLLFAWVVLVSAADAENPYASSQDCKNCHGKIYNEWKESWHAQAMVNPIFQWALGPIPDAIKPMCISCHAPTTRYPGVGLTDKITNEGVTCDFCHTVSGLNKFNPFQPYLLNPGNIKYGQFADSAAPHETQYLELLTKSEFCGPCHDLTFPNGVEVFGTYMEWNDSDYARKGIQCQDCHMKPKKRSIATGSPKREDSRKHEWKGGHSEEMVQESGELDLEAKATGSIVDIKAEIKNEKAGHKLPTGADSLLILKITAKDDNGKVLFENQTRFFKAFGNETGDIVLPDKATHILWDTRIPPNGKSVKEFRFDASSYEGEIKITGQLMYRRGGEDYMPDPAILISEKDETIEI